jgi:hypothetical protein
VTTGKIARVSTVEKVTVSLAPELLARIEERRREHTTRSEVVSDLLWRGWRQAEQEDREARYRAAYHVHPETDDELAWADYAANEVLSGDAGWATSQPQPGAAEPGPATHPEPQKGAPGKRGAAKKSTPTKRASTPPQVPVKSKLVAKKATPAKKARAAR